MTVSRTLVLALFLAVSVFGNIALAGYIWLERSEKPENRVGVLTKDVRVGVYGHPGVVVTLPKGLTVKNASPRGFAAFDLFEPNRFSIVVSSEFPQYVDYSAKPNHEFGALYSLDGEDLDNHPE